MARVRSLYDSGGRYNSAGRLMQTAEVDPDTADIYHATDFDVYFDPNGFASLGFTDYKPGGQPGQAVPITNSAGEELYVQPSGRCALASAGTAPQEDSRWIYRGGFLTLPNGRQLYATSDGWANADSESDTVDKSERQWSLVDGVFSLADGRQLYMSAGGAGLAMPGQYSNTSETRRVWLVAQLQQASKAFLALPNGHQLYARPDGRCDVVQPGSEYINEEDVLWNFDAKGFLMLPDGRQLYATSDGWANAAKPGQETNSSDSNRVWRHVDGVFTLADGRQLYTSAGGAGLAQLDQYSNYAAAADRRLLHFVEPDFRRPASPLTVLQDISRWEVIEGYCFDMHFPVNSGAVHTEEEETFVRHECMKMGYGGFHKKHGSYQGKGGAEDRPPVCFYMQKTQAELKALLKPYPGYTAYIAPPEHTPDSRFRPYAAACHCRWQMPQCPFGVTSFAVTVRVDAPTNSTYYMAIGFDGGYSGMQQGWGGTPASYVGRHQTLFSVWEPTPEHPVTTPYLGAGVTASAFGGGEGNGGGAYSNSDESSLVAFGPGEEVTFILRAVPDRSGEGTVLALMRHTERYGWEHFATHVVWVEDPKYRGRITGLHSFIEAFGGEYGLTSRSGVWKAWGQENDGTDWFPVTQVSGSCTMDGYGDKSYGNTRVGPYDGGVEMCTGGPRLNDGRGSEIYKGPIAPQPVPAHVLSAPASIFE